MNAASRMRVVVVGGAGNFGARIVRALRGDPNIELMVAGRRFVSVPGADDIPGVLIDIDGAGIAQAVKDLSPGLIIHCVGPFQGQDYRVASAALAAGAHYLDLADGRRFIADFSRAMHDPAVSAEPSGISGARRYPRCRRRLSRNCEKGCLRSNPLRSPLHPGSAHLAGEQPWRQYLAIWAAHSRSGGRAAGDVRGDGWSWKSYDSMSVVAWLPHATFPSGSLARESEPTCGDVRCGCG